MSNVITQNEKRRNRSIAFFADKKSGKYQRVTKVLPNQNTNGTHTDIPAIIQIKCEYCINFIFSNTSLILINSSKEPFPSSSDFLLHIKQTFQNSNIILFTADKLDILLAKNLFPLINLYIELNVNNIFTTTEERPVIYLRKYLSKNIGASSLSGPYVLITKDMNANNNKQYDIVKDIRRFYIFNENVLFDINYYLLLKTINESIKKFM